MSKYTAEEGAQIFAEVRQHPKRELIEAIAEATYELANEHEPTGGGGWWHLDRAHALVEMLPELRLVPTDVYTEVEYQFGTEQRTVWVGPWEPVDEDELTSQKDGGHDDQ